MKTVTTVVLTAFLLSLAGCGRANQSGRRAVFSSPSAISPVTIVARDRSCQVLLLAGWTERTRDDPPVVRASVGSGAVSLLILREPKENHAATDTSLDQERKYIEEINRLTALEKVTTSNGPTECTVNGRLAVRYELEAMEKLGGRKVRYLIVVVEGRKSFFRLAGTFRPSDEERYRPEIEEIMNSFTELP
jgi:hypothetical protein